MNNQPVIRRIGLTAPLAVEAHDTFIMENNLSSLRRMLGALPPEPANASMPDRIVMLVVRGMTERVVLTDGVSVVLGRTDLATGFKADVDLTPYGAVGRGVSRSHARLHLKDHQLFVTDLNSANGTYLDSKQLSPNQAQRLHAGSNLLLGALSVQVLFS